VYPRIRRLGVSRVPNARRRALQPAAVRGCWLHLARASRDTAHPRAGDIGPTAEDGSTFFGSHTRHFHGQHENGRCPTRTLHRLRVTANSTSPLPPVLRPASSKPSCVSFGNSCGTAGGVWGLSRTNRDHTRYTEFDNFGDGDLENRSTSSDAAAPAPPRSHRAPGQGSRWSAGRAVQRPRSAGC
jgi:hypothetical protein